MGREDGVLKSSAMPPTLRDQGDKDFRLESGDDSETDLEVGHAEDVQKDPEAALLLDTHNQSDDSDKTAYEEHSPAPGNWWRTRAWHLLSGSAFPWFFNLVLLLTLLSGGFSPSDRCKDAAPVLTPTIAQDYVEYRTETMYDGVDKRNPSSAYQGWPTPEKDALWDRFNGAMFRISHDEALTLPHLTLPVATPESLEKEEYLVGVTFTHALHCLNQLRRVAYPRHYNSSLIDQETGRVDYFKWWHIDHCVEVLRTYVTCHADMTPYTFDWVEGARISVHPGTVHTCKNFDRVMEVSSDFCLILLHI